MCTSTTLQQITTTYMFTTLTDKNVVTISFEVMGEAGAKHILVANAKSLHEHFLQIIALVLQQLHQAAVQRLWETSK